MGAISFGELKRQSNLYNRCAIKILSGTHKSSHQSLSHIMNICYILCDEDKVKLQNDINNLFKLSVRNMMNLYPDKCKVGDFTNKPKIYLAFLLILI